MEQHQRSTTVQDQICFDEWACIWDKAARAFDHDVLMSDEAQCVLEAVLWVYQCQFLDGSQMHANVTYLNPCLRSVLP